MRWIFSNLPNPSGRTMALGSSQPLTEMNTRVCEMYRTAKDAVGTAVHSTYNILLLLPVALQAKGGKCR
jgi:hypothetical protein